MLWQSSKATPQLYQGTLLTKVVPCSLVRCATYTLNLTEGRVERVEWRRPRSSARAMTMIVDDEQELVKVSEVIRAQGP